LKQRFKFLFEKVNLLLLEEELDLCYGNLNVELQHIQVSQDTGTMYSITSETDSGLAWR